MKYIQIILCICIFILLAPQASNTAAAAKQKQIKAEESKLTLKKGQHYKLHITVASKKTKKKLTYKSSKPSVVKVSASGKITAKALGSAVITIRSKSGPGSAKVFVTVTGSSSGLIRKTSDGKIRGLQLNDDVLAWFKVPYAKAPIGKLRWKAPQPNKKWSGIKDTTQLSASKSAQANSSGVVSGSEDCLYLNIYRPNNNTKNLPVMIYLHGGSNLHGSRASFSGKQLAKSANAVIVAINYRLGAFGFMNMDALKTGDTYDDSGNYAILDVIQALKWVRKNASVFGGNKNNVTLAGRSAGGRNALAVMVSPAAKGLFQKVMVFSSGFASTDPEEGQENIYKAFAKLVIKHGYASTSEEAIEWFKTENAAVIKKFMYSLSTKEIASVYKYKEMETTFFPQLFTDGAVIPEEGFEAFENGNYNKVPVLLGCTNSEFAHLAWRNRYFKKRRKSEEIYYDPTIKERYFQIEGYGSQLYTSYTLERTATALYSNSDQPAIYAYRFKWGENSSVTGHDYAAYLGATHGIDKPFITGVWREKEKDVYTERLTNENSKGRYLLSQSMQTYIANFLKSGNPNCKTEASWNRWTPTENVNKIMIFDATNTKNVSKMSSQYLSQEEIWKEMKEEMSEKTYQIMIKKFLSGRYFCKIPEEDQYLLEDDTSKTDAEESTDENTVENEEENTTDNTSENTSTDNTDTDSKETGTDTSTVPVSFLQTLYSISPST